MSKNGWAHSVVGKLQYSIFRATQSNRLRCSSRSISFSMSNLHEGVTGPKCFGHDFSICTSCNLVHEFSRTTWEVLVSLQSELLETSALHYCMLLYWRLLSLYSQNTAEILQV